MERTGKQSETKNRKNNCCCGKLVSKCNLAKHKNTHAHLDFLGKTN
jgi:hypothetical protein